MYSAKPGITRLCCATIQAKMPGLKQTEETDAETENAKDRCQAIQSKCDWQINAQKYEAQSLDAKEEYGSATSTY